MLVFNNFVYAIGAISIEPPLNLQCQSGPNQQTYAKNTQVNTQVNS